MERLKDVKDINEEITIRNGHTMAVTKLGDLYCEVTKVIGSKFEFKYVPEFWVDSFTINKELKNGFKLSNDCASIEGPVSLSFDQVIPTTNGFVTGVKMLVIQSDINHNAMSNKTINKSCNINYIHKALGVVVLKH